MPHAHVFLLPLLLALPQEPVPEPPGFDPAAQLLAEGRGALVAGDLGWATLHLQQALELAPGEGEIRRLLARTLNDRGKGMEALAVLDPEVPPPPSAWDAVERGRALRSTGDLEGAEAAFCAALASHPGCGAARLELSRDLVAASRLEEARATLEPLLADAPDEPAVLVEAARLLEAEGRAAEAVALLGSAIDREIGELPLRLALARLLLEAGRAEEAWDAVEVLLDEPLDVDSMVQVARVAQRADRPLDALAVLGAALVVDPTHPGALHDALELVEDASLLIERIARRRIEGNPEDVYGWEEMLQEYLHGGRCEEVLLALCDAPPAVRADPEVRLREATALRRLGRVDEARERLEALAGFDDPEVPYELGLLEYATGRYEAAEAAFSRSAVGDFAADAHYNRGLCARKLERHADAAEAFEAAVAVRADFLEAWLELGRECRFRLGDTQRARRAFARYLGLGGDDAEIRRWMEEGR